MEPTNQSTLPTRPPRFNLIPFNDEPLKLVYRQPPAPAPVFEALNELPPAPKNVPIKHFTFRSPPKVVSYKTVLLSSLDKPFVPKRESYVKRHNVVVTTRKQRSVDGIQRSRAGRPIAAPTAKLRTPKIVAQRKQLWNDEILKSGKTFFKNSTQKKDFTRVHALMHPVDILLSSTPFHPFVEHVAASLPRGIDFDVHAAARFNKPKTTSSAIEAAAKNLGIKPKLLKRRLNGSKLKARRLARQAQALEEIALLCSDPYTFESISTSPLPRPAPPASANLARLRSVLLIFGMPLSYRVLLCFTKHSMMPRSKRNFNLIILPCSLTNKIVNTAPMVFP